MNRPADDTSFEEQYLALRRMEGRLYTDEELRQLPEIRATHPLRPEWVIRKRSCRRLVNYLAQKKKALAILEVGCGNGWLCHRLSALPQSRVTGIDINATELAQAKRVFPSLSFVQGTLDQLERKQAFEVIVFAASIQYFQSVQAVLSTCYSLLKEGGEVHVLDTHFYAGNEAAKAAARSQAYFTAKGFPVMQDHYFHHTLQSLEGSRFKIMYDPTRWVNRLFRRGPFPWIRIIK